MVVITRSYIKLRFENTVVLCTGSIYIYYNTQVHNYYRVDKGDKKGDDMVKAIRKHNNKVRQRKQRLIRKLKRMRVIL